MKKLMMFLMIAIPLVVVIIVNLTTTVMRGDVNITVQRITLSEELVVANVGESEDLTYQIYPENATNKDVIWSSDNEQVAVVDNRGHVEFVGFGNAYVTATTLDGNKNAQCYFYVTDTKVHQVVLTAKQNYVHINETLQLTATVLPYEAENKNVKFLSSNPTVASVDTNGIVTGLTAGYTTITATSEDGGLQGVFDLEVWCPVTALSVDKTEVITSLASEQIRYQVEPDTATNRMVTFSVDNPELAEVSPTGLITFKQACEVNVTITTKDGGFSKTIKYIYTDGYAYSLTINTSSISMTVGDADVYLEYSLIPTNISKTEVEFVSDNEDVAYIVNERYLRAVKGGGTTIRARVHKSADEIIEQPILVMVKSPATAVSIEDGITASNTYQLLPKSLPEGSTNEAYFYHIDDKYSSLAQVTESGLLTFLTEKPCTIEVTIYANEDNSPVYKTVKVTFTAGMASSFNLVDHDITVKKGDLLSLKYNIVPENATILPLKMTLVSSTPVIESSKVIEILDNNKIKALAGGNATLKLEVTLSDNSVVEELCNINVIVDATKIDINLDIDYFNNQFVTAEKEVDFAGTIYPIDATNQNITWSIDNRNIASVTENKLKFKQVGVVTLTATIGDVSNSVEVYYAGSTPLYAEVKAIKNEQECAIPQKLMAEESFEIVISKIIPSNNTSAVLSLQTTNQRPTATGKVLEVSNNKVSALSSGTATLIVMVSGTGTLRFSFDISVERLPESITVSQANSQVKATTIELLYNVLPVDTSNKEVRFVVNTPDIAEIAGSTLTFKKNGLAKITAYCVAKEDVTLEFTIEKIERSAIVVSPDIEYCTINKGDILTFDLLDAFTIQILDSQPLIEGQEVAQVDGKYLKTIGAGSVTIQVCATEKTYNIKVDVRQLVENINFISDLDFVDNFYIFANHYVDLDFKVEPEYAFNDAVKISILEQISTDGMDKNLAYLVGKRIYFTKAGSATIQVDSVDGNTSKIYHLRYTGGDAIDAELNVGGSLVMEVGEQKEIQLVRWLPKDTINQAFVIALDSSSSNKVLNINNKTKTITALSSGEAKLIVELSNGITKEINVKVTKKVTDIDVLPDVLTANERYTIVAEALPMDATNRTLTFDLETTDIATIEDNVLYFEKTGTVRVTIKSTDGSNISKVITVTSTKGYLSKLELDTDNLVLNKNESINLIVNKYPTDALSKDVQFKILDKHAADGSDKEVIRLSNDGTIEAIYGGTATIRVFSHNFNGEEIYADCKVTILSPLDDFVVNFDHKMSYYQSAYITSRKEINFTTTFQPQDALIRTFKFEISNNDFAKIEDKKIVFTQVGRVTIKITSDDLSKGEISKIFTFYYTGDNLIEASLNTLGIENGVIRLTAGENFKFAISNALPDDNQNLRFTIQNIKESRMDTNKAVAHFENDTIYADHGGNINFDLYVNNLMLERITLMVSQDATDIYIWGDTEVYISQQRYAVDATIYPSDSTQSKLGYSSNGSEVADVSADGIVVFKEFGTVKVTIYVVSNPSIYKTITIQYTKELKSIQFNITRDKMFVDDYVDLLIIAQPFDAEDFEYEMTIDNESVAKIERREDGYRLKGLNKKGGEVKVTAKVIGKDISVEKIFTFYEKISKIVLGLDISNDNNGLGGYRVFGNKFIDENNSIVNTYQMNVNLIPSNDFKNLLTWSSNDEQIATVDQNGLVTFLSPGKVTISVSQIAPYDGAWVEKDSYQFIVVDGFNVENYNQFIFAHNQLNVDNQDKAENYSALVLHNDIAIEDTDDTKLIQFGYNVYGNGYLLDHSQINVGKDQDHFRIVKNNIELDNVVLRGYNLNENDSLTTLKDTGTTLAVRGCSGVLLYNSQFENSNINVIVERSIVDVKGCVFINSALAGIRVEHVNQTTSTVTVEDSIFTNSLLSGIIFNPIKDVAGQEDTLILKGMVRFYNWSTLDNVVAGFTTDLEKNLKERGFDVVMTSLVRQVKAILTRQTNMAYNYNKQDYYHFGVAKINVKEFNWGSSGTIDRSNLNPKCNYNNGYITGVIDFSLVSCQIEVSGITFSNPAPFIKPWESYTDNHDILLGIRQPIRF